MTPDGVLATLSAGDGGVTWPLLENDGKPLVTSLAGGIATTAFDAAGDQQCFLAIGDGQLDTTEAPVQSSYGWLMPVRSIAKRTFIYPRSPGDPTAQQIRDSFRIDGNGFASILSSVRGDIYVGRTSAGGESDGVDCDGDGRKEVRFDQKCRFMVQLSDGNITAVEADRKVKPSVGGKEMVLEPFTPVSLDHTGRRGASVVP